MNRNGLYLVIGLLALIVVVLGVMIYNEQTRPGIELRVDDGGISIQGNG